MAVVHVSKTLLGIAFCLAASPCGKYIVLKLFSYISMSLRRYSGLSKRFPGGLTTIYRDEASALLQVKQNVIFALVPTR